MAINSISPLRTTSTTSTTAVDPVGQQREVNRALDTLAGNVYNIGETKVDLMDFGILDEVSSLRETAANEIRKLATQTPALTPDQIKTQASEIVNAFREEAAMMNMMVAQTFSMGLFMVNWATQMTT